MLDDFPHGLRKVDVCEQHTGGGDDSGQTKLQRDEEVDNVLVDILVQQIKTK